jgi:hypothetical protein
MRIDTPADAVEFAASWIRETSPARARRQIGYAVEGQERALAIMVGNPYRYSVAQREQARATRRTLVAMSLYSEVAS